MRTPTETSIDRALKYSKAGAARMAAMQAALEILDERKIDGDVVECGVWRGGHIILARLISPSRRCWLYDTFDGMLKPTEDDGDKANGLFDAKAAVGIKMTRATIEEVTDNLNNEGVFDANLTTFVVGDVADTLRKPENLPDKIALLRLDTDWYVSTKVELEVLYPRLANGGILIVDDYGHWQGARKAVQEYFAKNGWDAKKLTQIDYTAVMMVKGV